MKKNQFFLFFIIFSFWGGFVSAEALTKAPVPKQIEKGPLSVEIISKTKLTDAKRNRTIPIKMYIPMDAPAAAPVYLFSHGAGGSRHDFTYLGNFLASYGFLGIFIEHPTSNGRIFVKGKSRISVMKSVLNDQKIWENRVLDLRFVIDSIPMLQKKFLRWQIPVDFSHLALIGHELGTIPVMALAGTDISFTEKKSLSDDRVRAFVAIAPDGIGSTYAKEAWANVYRPFMALVGSDDTRARKSPLWRHDGYFNMPENDKYLVNIKGARRTSYNNVSEGKKTARTQKAHKVIREMTLSFLIAYLMDDPDVKRYMGSYGIRNDFDGLADISAK
ncbi:MAG: alpha/beta hydrolase family protein [Alphaproteobacteria bacterium]